ncbi:MAG: glycosyltransferase family 77 protein [Actinomycetota bacterium]|nr:glycosyltransferase family 77 protein [Actinomycetota bacterium]
MNGAGVDDVLDADNAGPGRRKLVLTACGPAMSPLLQWSLPTHLAFAHAHGYDLAVHRLPDDNDRCTPAVRAAKWAKIELLRTSLDRHDAVLWLDVDTVVLRTDRDPLDDLSPTDYQGLALERFNDRCNPNTGVWLVRRDPRSVTFLDAVLDRGELPHSWADQATVCSMLGWDLGDFHGRGARPTRATVHRHGTRWLAAEWNAVGPHPPPGTRIAHLAGMPIEERARRMAALRRWAVTDRVADP